LYNYVDQLTQEIDAIKEENHHLHQQIFAQKEETEEKMRKLLVTP
jgi:hypothetical protein